MRAIFIEELLQIEQKLFAKCSSYNTQERMEELEKFTLHSANTENRMKGSWKVVVYTAEYGGI